MSILLLRLLDSCVVYSRIVRVQAQLALRGAKTALAALPWGPALARRTRRGPEALLPAVPAQKLSFQQLGGSLDNITQEPSANDA